MDSACEHEQDACIELPAFLSNIGFNARRFVRNAYEFIDPEAAAIVACDEFADTPCEGRA